jgi:hypothetical protein
MSPLPDKERVRDELQRRLPDLLWKLGFAKQARGSVLNTQNPRVPGPKASFAIWLTGDRAGGFYDFASSGVVGGDVFELIRYVEGLSEFLDAFKWAINWLGWDDLPVRSAEQVRLDRENAAARRALAKTREEAARQSYSHRLFTWWRSLPPITDTLAEVYLREARSIPLERIGAPKYRLNALRFCVRLQHTDDQTGEVTYWPAMVAAMTRDDLGVIGVHRTWLRPDGRGKAEVFRPKKMQGPTIGASIRLTRGPSGLSAPAAARKAIVGPLAIGEGIETCLSVGAAVPGWRVWAAGSLEHMGKLAWPECANQVVLLQDRDWGETARAAFERVVAHWRREAHGRRLIVTQSELGNDFNDWAGAA